MRLQELLTLKRLRIFGNTKNLKCKNRYGGKAQTNFPMKSLSQEVRVKFRMKKVLTNPLKLRNEEHNNYLTDLIYKMIVKVPTIANIQ